MRAKTTAEVRYTWLMWWHQLKIQPQPKALTWHMPKSARAYCYETLNTVPITTDRSQLLHQYVEKQR